MNIKELQKNWDAFGKTKPYWAILTQETKWDKKEFFDTGVREIDGLMQIVDSLGLKPRRGQALDFGCGAGRLTQALCRHFDQAYGVDIAPSMIKLANKHNKFKGRCHYFINDRDDLQLFESDRFDFIYCTIVLQHMQPEYSKNYLKEFLRVLAPGGLLIFQLPSHPKTADMPAPATPPTLFVPQSLPDAAFKAKIQILRAPGHMKAGTQAPVVAKVKNISETKWPAVNGAGSTYQIHLGNHWLNERGRVLVNDDARAGLPHDLNPQQEAEITIQVTAPDAEASILEFDMVQEGVTWFQLRGSETTRVPIKVTGSAISVLTRLSDRVSEKIEAWKGKISSKINSRGFRPVMEMHGVPQPEVIELLQSHGGTLIHIQDNDAGGEELVSYRYYVIKQ